MDTRGIQHRLHKNANLHVKAKVRILAVDDLPSVRQIFLQWVVNPHIGKPNTDEIDHYLSNMQAYTKGLSTRRYFVAEDENGQVIAVNGMQQPHKEILRFSRTDKPIEIVNMYVRKEYILHHIGKMMIRNSEKVARNDGFKEILIICTPRFKCTGWPFYKHVGYRVAGELLNEYRLQKGSKIFRKIL